MPNTGEYDLTYIDKLRNIGIELCEKYRGSKSHHKMKCTQCSFVWEATPIAKIRCYQRHKIPGCPKCTIHEKYEKQRKGNMVKLQEKFDILSDYNGQNSQGKESKTFPVTVRNKTCGHTFTSDSKNLIARNVNCPICNKTEKINRLSSNSKARSVEWQKTADIWDQYRHKVYMATRSTYHKHKATINPKNLPRGKAGTEGAYHLDHIIPVRWCFEHYVPVEICADVSNLQMLHWNDNVGSRDRLKEGIEIPEILRPYIPTWN